MAKVVVTESNLEDIGDAIRDRLQVNTEYLPSQMGDAIRSIPVIDVDPTLTLSGYAADAKVVGDRFDGLLDRSLSLRDCAAEAKATGEAIADLQKNVDDVADAVGVTMIEGFVGGQYIQTNLNAGDTVAINSPQTSSNFAYKVVSVSVGDKITLNATGGNAGRLWAFVDSSNALISNASTNVTASNLVLTAPANAAKLVLNVNLNATIGANYLGTSVDGRIAGNVDATLSVSGKAADAKMTGVGIQDIIIDQTAQIIGNENLLNGITWESGKYLDNNGAVYDLSSGKVSSKIEISHPYIYIFCALNVENDKAHKVAIYDENDTFLAYDIQTTTIGVDYFKIRLNNLAKYCRIATSIKSMPIVFAEANTVNTDQVKNGLQIRSLLEYNSVFSALDQNGDISSPSAIRCTTYNKLKNVVMIFTEDNDIQLSFYAFDKAGEPIGYFAHNSLSKTNITWTKAPIIIRTLPYYNKIGYIRIYCKNDEGFTDYRDCKKVHVMLSGNWFEQKKWYAIGDSITYGTFSKDGGGIERNPDLNYAIQCARMVNYDLTNYGVPNLGFTVNATDSSFTDQTIIDVMSNHTYEDAEIVTIALGTNDYGRNGTLGQLSDDSSVVSVYGRIKYIISALKIKCPKARIIFLTPIPRETSGTLATQFSKLSPNNSGFTLNDVKEAIINTCEYYGIECLNLLDNFPINYANYETYQKDGLHPTIQGHTLMAKAIAQKII